MTAEVVPKEWMQSVSECIVMPHRGARPFTLGEAVAELGTWARDARAEAWTHGGNRGSLDQDISAMAQLVGPRVLAVISDLLPNLETTHDRGVVSQAAGEFSARWTRPATIGAAFRDLCELAAAGPTMRELEPRARIIASQLGEAARGFGVLGDVKNLLAADPNERELEQIRRHDDLFLDNSPAHRLDAAERLLAADPPLGAVVVWSVYRRARVPWRTVAGPLTFLRASIAVPFALADDNDADFPEREELRMVLANQLWVDRTDMPGSDHDGEWTVLVRADLGTRSPLGAHAEAERRVDALLNIATGAGGVSWVGTGTSVTLLNGEPFTASFGANFEGREPFTDDYGIGATAGLVETWAKQLETAMQNGPMPDALVEALASVKEARLTDHRDVHFYDTRPATPRVATALEDHALEQIASLAQMKPEALMDELMLHEARRCWDEWAVVALAAPLDRRGNDAVSWQKRTELSRQIMGYTRQGARTLSLSKAWGAREGLRALATVPAAREGLEAALRAMSDPAEETRSRLRALEQTRLIRNRHRRVRNAVAHGNPVSPAALDSIRDYSERVTSDALSLALESYATSRPVTDIVLDRENWRTRDDVSNGSVLDRIAAGIGV